MRENIITKSFQKNLTQFLKGKNYSRHFILTDDNTNEHCLPVLLNEIPALSSATVIRIYAGEEHKTLQAAEYVWKRLTEEKADRNAVLINLGGGMVCDLGGFAASTFKRGIDFIHIPTTLLAQVDAAIGGKQGIDFLNYKNQIGVFKQPAAIFIHDEFLKTLPPEQITSGFAEVVKHALIAGGNFWKKVGSMENLTDVEWKEIVNESIEVKLSVVKKDPEEKNLRKVLNFGHTIGHAIESWLMNQKTETLHGHCVAAGIIGELYLSEICCSLSPKKSKEAIDVIKKHFPEIHFSENDFDSLIELMKQDKKNESGIIRMVLLHKFGSPMIDVEVDEVQIRDALKFMIETNTK
ncbi:MAG: 3-dehydroquinate synthase [Chitinophagales bacterium]